jgi:hypothetical protein
VTSLHGDSVGLSLVLGHSGVDRLDNVGTDGGLEDGGERGGLAGLLAIGTEDRDGRSGGLEKSNRQHFCLKIVNSSDLQFPGRRCRAHHFVDWYVFGDDAGLLRC